MALGMSGASKAYKKIAGKKPGVVDADVDIETDADLIGLLQQGFDSGEISKEAMEVIVDGLDINDSLRTQMQNIYSGSTDIQPGQTKPIDSMQGDVPSGQKSIGDAEIEAKYGPEAIESRLPAETKKQPKKVIKSQKESVFDPNSVVEQFRQKYESGEISKEALSTIVQGMDDADPTKARIQDIYAPVKNIGVAKEHPVRDLKDEEYRQQSVERIIDTEKKKAAELDEITETVKKEPEIPSKEISKSKDAPIVITNIDKADRRSKEEKITDERRKADRRKNAITRRNFNEILAKTETVEEAREIAKQMAKKAYVDKLTGLKNKAAWIENLIDEESSPDTPKQHKALIDIDNFSWVNDVLGHKAGDDVLAAVGKVINQVSSKNGYRFGGEEIIITNDDKAQLEKDVAEIQKRLRQQVKIHYTPDAERKLADGTLYKKGEQLFLKGVGISYGIDQNIDAADAKMLDQK